MSPLKPPPAVSASRICWQCRASVLLRRPQNRRTLSGKAASGSGCRSTSPPVSSTRHIGISKAALWPSNFFIPSASPSLRHVTTTFSPSTTNNSSSSIPHDPTSETHVTNSSSTPATTNPAEPTATANQSSTAEEPPPRPRRRARRNALASEFAQASGAPGADGAASLPPDASALLGAAAARAPASSLKRTLSALLSLSKPRLTVLVVLSAMAPYALYPSPDLLSPTLTETPSLSPLTLLFLTTGTALCSASANALNMLYEPRTDAMMTRTRNRPLVRALITKRAAVAFAAVCALLGVSGLYVGVNPTVSFLGAANIVLYAGVYTPMKRLSAANTWVGALVGGIPPLMGWAAAAGESATGDGSWRELIFTFPTRTTTSTESPSPPVNHSASSSGGWLLAALLFAWQFPHFMALSWPIRDEYRNAGLRMLCWVNPARNARVALRYSLAFIPICLALCATGVTEWSFAATSLPVNGWLAWQAVRFWKRRGHAGSARGLFWASVWHLPVVMVLALLQKKDMWRRVWASVTGEDHRGIGEDEDGENYADDDGEHEWVYVDETEEHDVPAPTPPPAPMKPSR